MNIDHECNTSIPRKRNYLLSEALHSMETRARLNTPESRKKKREEEKAARIASRAAKEAARDKSEVHLEARMPWPVDYVPVRALEQRRA